MRHRFWRDANRLKRAPTGGSVADKPLGESADLIERFTLWGRRTGRLFDPFTSTAGRLMVHTWAPRWIAAWSLWLGGVATSPAAWAQTTAPPSPLGEAPQRTPLTAERLPPPPADLAPLLERAPVSWEFYDRRKIKPRYEAFTRYDLRVEQRHRFRYELSRTSGGGVLITIRVRFTHVEHQQTYRIEAPDHLDPQRFWQSRLIRHEMDHVKISSHPFVAAEMIRQVKSVREFQRELRPGEIPTPAVISQWIDEEVGRKLKPVLQLVQDNNHKLDEITRHGLRAFDHEVFFALLYTRENLRAAGYVQDE